MKIRIVYHIQGLTCHIVFNCSNCKTSCT